MPGPTPTPTPILKLRGSWRANARQAEGEPVPPRGRPRRPATVKGEARKAWERTVPVLADMGVVSVIDRDGLEMYARTYARWQKLMAFLDEHGEVLSIKNKLGEVVGFKLFPQAKLSIILGEQLLRLAQQFGMTPAARTRLRVEAQRDDSDEKSRFFKSRA